MGSEGYRPFCWPQESTDHTFVLASERKRSDGKIRECHVVHSFMAPESGVRIPQMRCAVEFCSRSNPRLDISRYDRRPSLTSLELAAMGSIRRSRNPGWALFRYRKDVLRLIEPLEAARAIICSDLKNAPRRHYPL